MATLCAGMYPAGIFDLPDDFANLQGAIVTLSLHPVNDTDGLGRWDSNQKTRVATGS
jgi:hypothetical protein